MWITLQASQEVSTHCAWFFFPPNTGLLARSSPSYKWHANIPSTTGMVSENHTQKKAFMMYFPMYSTLSYYKREFDF
jgi:hypothetical protein